MKNQKIAEIYQDGIKKATIHLDRTVRWDSPMTGVHQGEENYINNLIKTTEDVNACIGVIFAAIILEGMYEKSGVRIDLLVPMDFQSPGDVIA